VNRLDHETPRALDELGPWLARAVVEAELGGLLLLEEAGIRGQP
jgi:hypothetical protein